jgi:D-alanyl-D-alanine carboxypeptidase/D-alanyl-D-alanine-endopeptidase (penicillin-binding protein 4)
VPASAQDVDELRRSLSDAIGSYRWGPATWGVAVRSLDTDESLFELNPDVALAPASNLKLLTSAAALHVLGPEYRFRTYLLTAGRVEDGVVHGDLVLYGTGDPGISGRFYRRKDEVFQRLIDQLEEAGIHTIRGDVVADASFFPGPLRHQGWETRDLNEHFTAGVSSVSYNENVVSFRIVAGPPGAPPQVQTIPSPSGLEVVNIAETVLRPSRPRLAILREDPLEPVRVEGRMVAGTRDVWRQMTVAVPARFAGEVLHDALVKRGLTVRGETRIVELPYESVVGRVSAPTRGRRGARILARHVSRPLGDYLAVINKESNNLFAELVFRATGRAAEGSAHPRASARAVMRTLHDVGVDTVGLSLLDGSGLSAGNRVSAQALVQTIAGMEGGPLWPEYWASLPQAGTRGELGRMYRTAAAGNLRAKTGTIEGVSALSGLVRTRDGERLAFSLIVNDAASQTRAKRVENVIGAQLASFERRGAPVPIVVAQTPAPRATSFTNTERHLVARGENLSAIALRYGLSLDEILEANPRLSPNRIVAGQWIDLPQRGGS